MKVFQTWGTHTFIYIKYKQIPSFNKLSKLFPVKVLPTFTSLVSSLLTPGSEILNQSSRVGVTSKRLANSYVT